MTSNAAMRVAGYFARSDDANDADLLLRFVAERDGEAFAVLVRRHGPMVFGVCRRVLGDWHLAEDAFQAAFVVLARKAAAVSPPGAVAGWLHGVAHRVAKDARRSALRRFQRERPTDMLPELPTQPPHDDTEFQGVLDDELQKLPGKYRQLLVACDLEGRPRQPVAEGLGIPEGTLSSRLTTARKMLASRLTKRGIAPAIVAGIAANGPSVVACEVPRALLASTARIGSAVTSTVPATVATLSHGAIRAMTIRSYLPWTAGLLVAASAALGYAGTRTNPQPIDPALPKPLVSLAVVAAPVPMRTVPKPLPQGPNKIAVSRAGHLVLIDPDGKNETKVLKLEDTVNLDSEDFRLSPDGKRIAVIAYAERPGAGGDFLNKKIVVRELGKDGPGTDLGVGKFVFWSGDGTELLIAEFTYGAPGAAPTTSHAIVNLATKARTAVKLPADHIVSDWSRDGKFLLTTQSFTSNGGQSTAPRVWLMNRDGTEPKALTDGKHLCVLGKFSPDGKRVLFMEEEKSDRKLTVFELATGKATPVEHVPENADLLAYCWSPDGKQIAYTWRKIPDGMPVAGQETESFLVVCDSDGKNARTVATEKSALSRDALVGVDWR